MRISDGSSDVCSSDQHGDPGFTHLAVQRKPGTRIHCMRVDGTVAVLIYQPAEEVNCWVEVETDGDVEDIVVLPGTREDADYYLVQIGRATWRGRVCPYVALSVVGVTITKKKKR